ncbi:RiPP maturation radical SAM protein 1 [Duganella sp. FT80W]|uniref:RiPP maturation radical SAM protein 1 n=1 Tax=Duganella guangzhouensis TaxID=2666084 RepID=A0A6I2L7V4_9BURK|nr:RiPP maturation radical SAM C-methyltransferase [Duganella guangzhouensis]MRW93287.1 RiPP maturation radical SAM protein 1 [Duganella guangzhouensis]
MMTLEQTITPPLSSKPAPSFKLALVCMPFASADRPSIQLGLLGAIAEQAGFEVDLLHFNLDLSAQLGPELYEQLCERRAHMTGEWLFGPAAFGAATPADEAAFLRDFPSELSWIEGLGKQADYLTELRQRILPRFIARSFEAIDWSAYRLVGFSSMFQQNVASLALARRIKDACRDVAIVFGGANMEGEMGREYARAFDFLDYVVSGEADLAFPALLRAIARGERLPRIGGVTARGGASLVDGGESQPVLNLDALPVPNYAPYFEHANQLGLGEHYSPTWTLPYESSRGCWWGQKHHCTFCGLNGNGMVYRAKQAPRMLAELAELADKHRICSFMAVDNILDLDYVKQLFGPIEQARLDYCFFYEVKANLTREQIHALYRGGVRRVQPGIESLSTPILKLMRKGSTMLQNVRCLKWCAYYGIGVNWNLIWGFPGETSADYQRELEVLRCLTHFEPPVAGGRIWLERFSPHFNDPAFPVTEMRAEASYAHVYPSHVDLMKAAYFFDYEMGDTVSSAVHAATNQHIEQWKQAWREGVRPRLAYRRIDGAILIDFNRGPGQSGTYRISGVNAEIYTYCSETMRSPAQVADHLLTLSDDNQFELADIRDALDEFCGAGLMLGEDDKYLSLALPANPNW